jgi:hypothetical protein
VPLQKTVVNNIPAKRSDPCMKVVVEDDFDRVMGGIVGCDGLFSTTMDIAVFL